MPRKTWNLESSEFIQGIQDNLKLAEGFFTPDNLN